MSLSRFFNPTSTTSAVSGNGFAVPRMSTTDRLAIVFGPSDKGMAVYDTTLNNEFTWNGTAWESTPSSGDSANTEVIYNDAGILKGDPTLTFDNVSKSLLVDTLIRIWRGATKLAGNVFVGGGTGAGVTTGNNNTGIGVGALGGTTTTSGSTAVGTNAGLNSNAGDCVFVGASAGLANAAGTRNTYIGALACLNGAGGGDNSVLGYLSLSAATGSRNTAVGSQCLTTLTTGIDNVAVGFGAGASHNSDGIVAIGFNSLAGFTGTGGSCCAVGYQSLWYTTTGDGSTSLGYLAGRGAAVGNGLGARNTTIGRRSLLAGTTTAVENVSIGADTMCNPSDAATTHTGINNVVVGNAALRGPGGGAVVSASNNVALGTSALFTASTVSDTVAVGSGAGSNLTTGSSNICLGSASQGSAATVSNELSIGSAASFVGTNGAAATYFATATAGAVVLGNAVGFIRINLNGTFVKIPVYGN